MCVGWYDTATYYPIGVPSGGETHSYILSNRRSALWWWNPLIQRGKRRHQLFIGYFTFSKTTPSSDLSYVCMQPFGSSQALTQYQGLDESADSSGLEQKSRLYFILSLDTMTALRQAALFWSFLHQLVFWPITSALKKLCDWSICVNKYQNI